MNVIEICSESSRKIFLCSSYERLVDLFLSYGCHLTLKVLVMYYSAHAKIFSLLLGVIRFSSIMGNSCHLVQFSCGQ